MELRALTVIDSLQPQLTGFLQTVCAGFMPLEEEAAAFIEIAPGTGDPCARITGEGTCSDSATVTGLCVCDNGIR